MSTLTPADQALLELARGGDEPSAADEARIGRALVTKLGAGVGLTVTTAASARRNGQSSWATIDANVPCPVPAALKLPTWSS